MFGNKDPQPKPVSQYVNIDPNAGKSPTPNSSNPPSNPYPSSHGGGRVSFVPEKSAEKNKTLTLFLLSISTILFAGLFVWKFLDWASVENKIEMTVSDEVERRSLEIETKVTQKVEEEKNSDRTNITGPSDYGSLSLSYPKTWSVYIVKDATITKEAKDNVLYEAYFHPNSIGPISNDSVFALRVMILSREYTDVVAEYNNTKDKYEHHTVTINNGKSTVDVYDSTPESGFKRKEIIFKIRGQTAIIRTDSVDNFGTEFNKILDTVTFAE